MADEAFALSPIEARATQPREEDYAAIADAFMETSRGRWFLGEYAKRNRNADTRMVLDAVARIEQSLVAQKEESLAAQRETLAAQREAAAAQSAAAAAVVDNSRAEARLLEALTAIRGALEAARDQAMEAIDSLALNDRLAPVRKGARVIREIAWRLREIGNDGRICDLIDSQVAVIEQGAEQISSDEAKAALEAAFASLAGRIAEFGDAEEQAPVAEAQGAAPASQHDAPIAAAEAFEAAPAPGAAEAPIEAPAMDAAPPAPEAMLAEADTALEQIEAAELADITAETADAQDEAVLDMIAMEMGVPDPIDDDELIELAVAEARIAEPMVEAAVPADAPPPEPEPVAQVSEPVAAPVAAPVQAPSPPVMAPEAEVSLGSSIIASGLVRKPVAANDPLAPIRRMSQAEKIAFFS